MNGWLDSWLVSWFCALKLADFRTNFTSKIILADVRIAEAGSIILLVLTDSVVALIIRMSAPR